MKRLLDQSTLILRAPVLVLLLSLLLTAALVSAGWSQARARDELRFQFLVADTEAGIVDHMHSYITMLRSGAGFINANGDRVGRKQFREYVEALRLSEFYPGILGYGFSVRLPDGPVAEFEASMREEYPSFRVWPEEPREEVHSIAYLEPLNRRNRAAIGYDMYTEPIRREAMARARDSGEAALSSRVTLVQEIDANKQAGFLIYVPVYRAGSKPKNVEERRQALIGFVYAPFRTGDLLNRILPATPDEQIAFRLYAGADRSGAALLYTSPGFPAPGAPNPWFTQTRVFPLVGDIWTLEFVTRPEFDANSALSRIPYMGALGLCLCGLLFSLTVLLARARQANVRAYHEERKRAEALAELDHAKTVFFSNVSHEFRTPLTLMLGPTEDALGDAQHPLPPRQRERLELIQRNARRLLKLVNSMLDFSRLEAGKLPATYRPTDLTTLTRELASVFSQAIEGAGISFQVECDPLPEKVWIDADLWEKIVLNLISNAFKFTHQGEIRVSLSGEERVVLQVADTGIGIPEEEQPKVFDRFHQVHHGDEKVQQGSGIGLALVKELVKLHGGEIVLKSSPGVGSVFEVTLPFGKEHLPPESVVSEERSPEVSEQASLYLGQALGGLRENALTVVSEGGRPRILLADDNPDLRSYVVRLLEHRYDVVAVPDGEAAWRQALETPPDLVLSDVMMPRKDGYSLLSSLKENPATSTVPVILLSAQAGEQARISGLEAGADDYLIKPFSARELQARVAANLESALINRRVREELSRALELSEARHRSLIASIPGAVYQTEPVPPWRFTFCSPAINELTGYPVESWLQQGLTLGSLADPERREQVEQHVAAALVERRPFSLDHEITHADGSVRYLLDRGHGVYSPEGEAISVEGVLVDITARRQAEEAERARVSAISANRAKSEFLASLSHELRTPLNGIVGMGGLLWETELQEQQKEYVSTIDSCSRALLDLISDVLDLSKIEAGKLELEPVDFNLKQLFEESLKLVEAQALGKSLSCRLEWDSALPLRIHADPARLRQVLLNLLSNAVKFTHEGSVTLRVRLLDGDRLQVAVVDTGVGIPREEQHRLFKAFSQIRGHEAFHDVRSGTGLGLAICREIVETMGGTIGVESEAGQGATFFFELPVIEAPEEALSAGDAPPPAQELKPDGERRILIADDNAINRRVLSLQLSRLGYLTDQVENGEEALKMVQRRPYHLVLMDCQMPVMDGFEATREIRRRIGGALPIVALTAHAQPEHERLCFEAGMDDFITKPVALDRLARILKERTV